MSAVHVSRLLRHSGFAFVLSGLAAAAPVAARAEQLIFPNDNAIARAILPYSPWIFDLIVQGARNAAEITYDRRGYDPVTNTFFVNGLHVRRDLADMTIGRLRTNLTSVMLEGISIDEHGLDPMLPPPLSEGLRKLGRDRIEGDVLIGIKSNLARSAYDITMRYDLADIGVLSLAATVDGFHVLVPLSDFEFGDLSREPLVTGSLVKASAGYQDHGLMPVAIDMSSEQSGVTSEQMKVGLTTMASQLAAQFIGSLPGGVSPALKDRIFAWAATAEGFLRDEDAIYITLDPAEPVPLRRLETGLIDEALIATLNPNVTRGPDEAATALPQPGTLDEANGLISGTGAPQDREAGVRSLLTLAGTGHLDAVRAIAASFADASAPDLSPGDLAGLYAYLLVARALDGGVGDAALSSLTRRLPPDSVLAAEHDASVYFAAHGPSGRKDIGIETISGYDAAALRAAAYDFYEGHGVPRDFTHAFSLSLVAAAAGDPFAADLRDDLAAAAERKDVVLGIASAHAEAARLWAAYQAAHPGTKKINP